MTRLSTSILIALAAIAWVCSAAAPSATCEHPAPIMGKWDAAAPGYVVAVRNDTDLETVLTRLARKYNFKLLVIAREQENKAIVLSTTGG
jgi:uncharacterized protein YdbL (DUF1318 family)